jgi:predicted amidophosphoribosyltransferase
MWTDLADLVLARTCLGCERFGRTVCESCWASVSGQPHWINIASVPISVGTTYEGLGRTLVLAHKRSLLRSLGVQLGQLLADALGMHPTVRTASQVVHLVTIPPHARAKRERGQDTVAAVARNAAHRVPGAQFRPIQALSFQHDAGSLAGLNRHERRNRMADAFTARPGNGALCVVVDDVVTTGSTLHSAVRALREESWQVLGCSAVAGVR